MRINNKVKPYLFLLALASLLAGGCVTTSGGSSSSLTVSAGDYVNLESFCVKRGLNYKFDTLSDLIVLYSKDKEINLLLGSRIGTVDGSIFQLKNSPLYFKNEIMLPLELEDIIVSENIVSFKPVFEVKTVVVDPGHGGKDPGAISRSGLKEKTVNLKIAKYLKQELEKKGFKVFLTRDRDEYLSLNQRVNIAKKHDADLFISLHANSNRSRNVKGAEVYYLSPSRVKSHERSLKLAKQSTFYGKDVSYTVKAILWDMLISKNYSNSIEVSGSLYYSFKKLGFNIKPPKKAPFYVLRFAYTPSVLVEVGYLSNKIEEKALRKDYYRRQLAQAIALGVDSLKNE